MKLSRLVWGRKNSTFWLTYTRQKSVLLASFLSKIYRTTIGVGIWGGTIA
jgi:hypothetical protein